MRRWLLPIAFGLVLALLAWQLTLVAIPRVLMSAAITRLSKAGINRFTHAPMATDKSRVIVRPSPDLAYSSCPFDVSKGPVLIEVAPVGAPYWSLSIFDGRTDVAFVRNNRDSGGKAIRIVLAREGEWLPKGMEAVRLGYDRGIALIRILVEDRGRFVEIDAARRKSICTRLLRAGKASSVIARSVA